MFYELCDMYFVIPPLCFQNASNSPPDDTKSSKELSNENPIITPRKKKVQRIHPSIDLFSLKNINNVYLIALRLHYPKIDIQSL